jgi:hypothetical protein
MLKNCNDEVVNAMDLFKLLANGCQFFYEGFIIKETGLLIH